MFDYYRFACLSFPCYIIPHRCRNDHSDSSSSLFPPDPTSYNRTCPFLRYETQVRDSSAPTCVGSWQKLPGLSHPQNRQYASVCAARTPDLLVSPSRLLSPCEFPAFCSREQVRTNGFLLSLLKSSHDSNSTSRPVHSWVNKCDILS